jgi:uncharacterized protein YqgV (UPF0045/DUF77 family)
MKLSVEISKYPLADEYIVPIKDFIDRLNQHPELHVITNTMSTQVFGDFDVLMPILNTEMRDSFAKFKKMIFICKFINADLSPAIKEEY